MPKCTTDSGESCLFDEEFIFLVRGAARHETIHATQLWTCSIPSPVCYKQMNYPAMVSAEDWLSAEVTVTCDVVSGRSSISGIVRDM